MKAVKSNPVKTVLIISTGFAIVYLITNWQWSIVTAVIVGVLGILSVKLSKLIDYFWMKLAWLLSLIIPNILLGLIFYLFLFPIAILSRVFGKTDSLQLKNKSNSLWVNRDDVIDKLSFEKTW